MHTTGANTRTCILRSLYNQTSEQWIKMQSGKKLIYFPILAAVLVTHVALELLMLVIILKPIPVLHPVYVYSASTLLNNVTISDM